MGHGHNTDNCIQLKDALESLINKGRLSEYVIGGKQDREESPNTKSPTKVPKYDPNGEKGETSKGKHPYITA